MTIRELPSASYDRALEAIDRTDFTSYIFQYPPLGLWRAVPNRRDVERAWRRTARRWRSAGLYVHVPFCRTKCSFCRFFVLESDRAEDRARLLEGLELEADLYAPLFKGRPFRTLYVGGGTPSLLRHGELKRLFGLLRERFSFVEGAQTAFEANPEFLDARKLRLLRDCGVDRLTLGVQSFDDRVVKAVDRTQSPGAARRSFEEARRAGIPFINIDLMCGLPGQDLRVYLRDVKEAVLLRPDMIHTSAFMPTPFTRFSQRGGRLTDERRTSIGRMHAAGRELLLRSGYRPIRHDSLGLSDEARNRQLEDAVVERVPFLGLGPGAVSSATGELRYVNMGNVQGYLARLKAGRSPVLRGHAPSAREEQVNYAMNSFWYGELDLEAFRRHFGEDAESAFGETLSRLEAEGWIRRCGGVFRLSESCDESVRRVRRAFFEPEAAERLAALRPEAGS